MSDLRIRGKLNKSRSVITLVFYALTALMLVCFFYYYRKLCLFCHDSMRDALNSRMHDLPTMYVDNLKFNLARGRFGFIFPAVCTFRNFITSTGNYTLIWLLQYMPILGVTILIAYILKKEINLTAGIAYIYAFFLFAQIDYDHNLFVCYPLDFMFCLFFGILGVWLFKCYIKDVSEGKKGKKLQLAVSLLSFFVSLEGYEAFLTLAALYACIAIHYAWKREGMKERILFFVKGLIPHFLTSVLYLGLMVILRRMDFGDYTIISFTNGGKWSIKNCLVTWFRFSTNMFPLHQYQMSDRYHMGEIATKLVSKTLTVYWIVAILAAILLIWLFISDEKLKDADYRKSLARKFFNFGFLGGLGAGLFTLPHGLTATYQNWHVYGYVPSTISYFGWIMFCFCVVAFLINLGCGKGKILKAVTGVLAFALVSVVSYFTVMNNQCMYAGLQYTCLKGQTVFYLAQNDLYEENDYSLLYSDDMIGIHYNLDFNEQYMKYETNDEYLEITNEKESYFSLYNGGWSDNAAIWLIEDDISLLARVRPNYEYSTRRSTEPEDAVTDDLMLFSVREADILLVYETIYGERLSTEVHLGAKEAVNIPVNGVLINTIEIVS